MLQAAVLEPAMKVLKNTPLESHRVLGIKPLPQSNSTFVYLRHAEALNTSLLLFRLHPACLSDWGLYLLRECKTLHAHFINPRIAYSSRPKLGWVLHMNFPLDTTSMCSSPALMLFLTLQTSTAYLLPFLMEL